MKNIAAYLRVSSEDQTHPEKSLRTQKETIERYLKHKHPDGYNLQIYKEEGKSAKNTSGRPVWKRMVRDIELGLVDILAVQDWDRAFRSVTDAIQFDQFRKDHNIQFISVTNNIDTETADGWQMFVLVISFAEKERRKVSERVKRSIYARTSRGNHLGGRRTFGYDHTEDKGVYKINEHEAHGVRLAYEKYMELGSFNSVAEELNSAGYRTPTHETAGGKTWERASISHMLENLAYIAKQEVNKNNKDKDQSKLDEDKKYKLVNAVWPPIIDEGLFNRVQDLIKRQRELRSNTMSPETSFYPYAGGVSVCACGGRYSGTKHSYKKKGGEKYIRRYYMCNKCGILIHADMVEKVLDQLLQDIVTKHRDELHKAIKIGRSESEVEIESRKAEIRNIKSRSTNRDKERKELLKALANARSEKAIKMINDELETLPESDKMDKYQLDILERELRQLKEGFTVEEIEAELQEYRKAMKSDLDKPKQKLLIRHIFKQITLSKETAKVELNIGGICKELNLGR